MSDIWEIKGQSGKALNATLRSFEAAGVIAPVLRMPKLAVETFTYQINLDALTIGTELVPDEGQEVSIYLNGTRIFWGNATRAQAGFTVHVTVRNPWFWLERVNFTSTVTDATSATAERLTFQHPSQSLTTSLTNTINRAIALGVPMRLGSLAATFACPQITFNQMSLATGIAELIRKTPDMQGFWDYSDDSGYPVFNTSRRGTATVTTLALGDLDPGWRVAPVSETLVTQVITTYLDRDPTSGRSRFREQSSGDSGTAQGGASGSITLRSGASKSDDAYNGLTVSIASGTGAGQTKTITDYNGTTKVATVNSAWTTAPNNTSVYVVGTGIATTGQLGLVTTSGTELDTYLPNNKYDTFSLQTATTGAGDAAFKAWVIAKSAELAALAKKYSFTAASFPMSVATGGINLYTGSGTKTVGFDFSAPSIVKADGSAVVLTGKNLILGEKLPEWATQYTVEEVTVKAEMATQKVEYAVIAGSQGPLQDDPLWFADVNWTWFARSAGRSSSNPSSYSMLSLFKKAVEVKGYLINASFPTAGTIYRPADYTFVFPPDGFAAGLAASQGFVRYEGDLSITEEVGGSYLVPGNVINLTGGLSELATMKALISEITLEPDTGRTTIRLGAPDRHSLNSFIDSIRGHGTNNVVVTV